MAARNGLKLFVGNLPWTVGQRELRQYFSEFGHVALSQVMFDKNTGLSKGYGFVVLGSREAYNAASNKASHILEGSHLNVQPAK